jgi:hypothetical protein
MEKQGTEVSETFSTENHSTNTKQILLHYFDVSWKLRGKSHLLLFTDSMQFFFVYFKAPLSNIINTCTYRSVFSLTTNTHDCGGWLGCAWLRCWNKYSKLQLCRDLRFSWRWWYPSTALHGVTAQNTTWNCNRASCWNIRKTFSPNYSILKWPGDTGYHVRNNGLQNSKFHNFI